MWSNVFILLLFILIQLRPVCCPLFPYTTLFRSYETPGGAGSCHCPRSADSAVRRAVCRSGRSEEHTSELQSRENLVCRLLLEKKKITLVIIRLIILRLISCSIRFLSDAHNSSKC